jgi:ABC-2 type transport system permease protein
VSGASLTLRQVRFTNKAFWRNPASAFFTFAFPLMFLVIFTSLLGGGRVEVRPGVLIEQANYYVAAMTAFAVVTACFTNLAMSVTYQRDAGILKRTRGTPLPGWAFLAGRVIHAMLVALLLVVITTAFGVAFYAVDVPTGARLAELAVVLGVGAASFAALGLATTAAVPNADAAPAVVNAIILPLLLCPASSSRSSRPARSGSEPSAASSRSVTSPRRCWRRSTVRRSRSSGTTWRSSPPGASPAS